MELCAEVLRAAAQPGGVLHGELWLRCADGAAATVQQLVRASLAVIYRE
jgi:hypothetical protein